MSSRLFLSCSDVASRAIFRISSARCRYLLALSESLAILGRFKENGHIDPDLFDIFVRDKVYLRYAREFLDPEQIDEVDESRIPGFKR